MSKLSDQRIQRHKQKQKDTADAQAQRAQQVAEERERKNRFLADLRLKWANDMRIIADVLQDFGSKLDGYFQLGDLGAPPLHTAAHTRITGKLDKGPLIDIKLAVDEEGRLRAVRYKSAVGFPSSDTLMVTDATREQYEDFILDLFNIEK